MSGQWISIDGCEGCGKTTLVRKLRERYPDFMYIPEFSDSIIGKTLNNAVKNEPYIISDSIIGASLLFLSDYFQMIETLIVPNLKQGAIIISDRGFVTKIAVQAAVMSEFYDREQIQKALTELFRLSIMPNCTIVMDIPLEVIKSRLLNKDGYCDEEREKFIRATKQEISNYANIFDLKTSRIFNNKEAEEIVLNFKKYFKIE